MKVTRRFVDLILIALPLLGPAACTHAPVASPGPIDASSIGEYVSLVERHTRHTNQYSGLYQTFQADVTILDADMQNASLRQRAHYQGWDQKLFQMEREKVVQEQIAYAKFFLRFFAGDRDYDDLNKPKTIWKVYLEYGGSRFEGKITRIKDKLVELRNLYPNMDRFSSPYEITFNIPMATVERGRSKVVLTSSMGTAEFVFEPGQ